MHPCVWSAGSVLQKRKVKEGVRDFAFFLHLPFFGRRLGLPTVRLRYVPMMSWHGGTLWRIG